MAETIGIYKNTPLVVEPSQAVAFAVIGWIIVLGILFFAIYKWYKRSTRVVR